MQTKATGLAALLAIVAVAGCTDPAQTSLGALPAGAHFTVARLDGNAAPDGMTLDVGESGRITGQAPCNRYSGMLFAKNGAMTISGVTTTRMACADPARTHAETRFVNALGAITGTRKAVDGGVALIDTEDRERIVLMRTDG